MMKKIILAALGASVISTGVFASTSATGFFVEVNGGGVYTKIEEYFAQESDSKNRIKILEASKKIAAYVGGGLGYGYEFTSGFYLGGKIYGLYDATKVTKEAADETNSIRLKYWNVATKKELERDIKGSYKIEYKPMFSYGATIQAGYKVMPNFLVYAALGGEGTYTKAKQWIECDDVLLNQGESSKGYSIATLDGKSKFPVTPQTGGNEEMKVTTFSIVPGIGVKWFITPNIFIGADAALPVGFIRKVDKKYFEKGMTSFVDLPAFDAKGSETGIKKETKHLSSPAEAKLALQVKRNINVRYGVSVGYKF